MDQGGTPVKRILYVETASGVGGSITNVLYPMVAGLDRNRYEPVVLFYWPNPYQERFETLGVETMLFNKPKPWTHPAPVARLQQNKMVKSFQTGKGRSRALYHALGSYLQIGYHAPQVWRLAQLLRAGHIDLVHLNSVPVRHGREIVLASKLADRPVVCYAQNFSEFQAIDQVIARLIDQYIFCSQAIGQHCIKYGGALPTRGRTIYPCVADVAIWSQPYDTFQIRRELGWPDQAFVVGCIGRLVPWKGQHIFLKALAEVKRAVPDIKGLIVGGPKDTDFYEQLLNLTESLDLRNNAYFTGFRDDIPQIMASLDVLVHSSCQPEPFATVVIEGMMAGRPVIATNAGGMPEMIKHGVTGLLVEIDDPQAMADAILYYYRDRTRAGEIALAGQQRATTELTAQRHVDEFHKVYRTLLA